MWKLLRNLVLGALLLAGGIAVALWAVAQQQGAEIASRLSTWGDLTYSSASAGVDGVVHLHDVHFVAKPGLLPTPIHAMELQVRSPGPLWLLRRAITHDTEIPEQLGVSLLRAQLPPLALLGSIDERSWINPTTLVPFEAFGCATATRLTDNDYQAMGLSAQFPDLSVDYRYDSGTRGLVLDLAASNAGFAALRLHADMSEFSPRVFTQTAAQSALRADTVMFDYSDGGFLARRNQYCAKRGNIALSAFVDQHVAAVLEALKQRRIVVAESLAALYRDVVVHGGALHLLSLPSPNIVPAQYKTYDPEQVLRFLNLTARHDDAPPVLFKLFFLAPETTSELADIDPALVHDPLAEPSGALVVRAQSSEKIVAATPVVTPPPPPTSAASSIVASGSAKPVIPSVKPEAPVVSVAPSVAATPTPVAKPPSGKPPVAAVQPPVVVTTPAKPAPARTGEPALPSSSTRPPANSTAALVWLGTGIERLPEEEAPREREFLVVAYDALASYRGTRVTLITAGGKELEGTVEAVDEAGITLSVQRESGRAEFYVERARILEIRLVRRGRG